MNDNKTWTAKELKEALDKEFDRGEYPRLNFTDKKGTTVNVTGNFSVTTKMENISDSQRFYF